MVLVFQAVYPGSSGCTPTEIKILKKKTNKTKTLKGTIKIDELLTIVFLKSLASEIS